MISRSRSAMVLFGFCLSFLRLAAADAMDMKTDMKPEILSSYVKVSTALAADDLTAAKSAASAVAEHAGMSEQKEIAAKAQKVATAPDIEAARSVFKDLSTAIEPLAADQKGFVTMHCSMADADWVQGKGKTQNPYYGKAMLSCGSPKKSK